MDQSTPAGRLSAGLDPRRLTVAFVSEHYPPYLGGLQQQAAQLGAALAARGHRVTVLTRQDGSGARSETKAGVVVERLGPSSWPPRGASVSRQIVFALAVSSHLTRHRRGIDAVHFHGASFGAALAAAWCRVLGLPTIAKVSNQHCGEAGLAGRPLAPIRRALLRRFGAVVAVSHAIAADLAADGVARHRVVRLPNFVDLDRFRLPTPVERTVCRRGFWPEWDETAVVVLAAGRLMPHKNVGVLLAALARTPATGPLRMAIAGDGPDRPRLERLTADLALHDRVRFLGTLDPPDAAYRAADLFAQPSRWEGMPNAVLEAAASGLPVVASRVPGIVDIFGGGEARLVGPDDVEGWARALGDLGADAEGRAVMGVRAREVIARRHALPSVVRSYEDLYPRLPLGGVRAAGPAARRAVRARRG